MVCRSRIFKSGYKLNNRKVSRETATACLIAIEHYKKAEVAFQCKVPAGSIMTVIESAPKPWYARFISDRYFVKLEPDLSRGLDIILTLDRGMEGSLDGLNPELFERIEKK